MQVTVGNAFPTEGAKSYIRVNFAYGCVIVISG
jgi:hypothetical protein